MKSKIKNEKSKCVKSNEATEKNKKLQEPEFTWKTDINARRFEVASTKNKGKKANQELAE